MSLPKHEESDWNHAHPVSEEETQETRAHHREVRRIIEDRLERKRLRDEIDELDGDFNWDELDK